MASLVDVARAAEILFPDPERRAAATIEPDGEWLFVDGPHPDALPDGACEPGGPGADETPGDGWCLSAAPSVVYWAEYESWVVASP